MLRNGVMVQEARRIRSVADAAVSMINLLAAARVFLFGARDVWFVVGLPVFLYAQGWVFTGIAGSHVRSLNSHGVVAIRDRAVVPTERASRMIVFGLFVGILAVTAFVLVLVGVLRLLSIPLPVWAAWMVEGVVLAVAGYLVWRQRSRFEQDELRG